MAALGILLLGAPTPAVAAQGSHSLRHCRAVQVGTVKAVHVKANYRCRSARKDLKRLLRRGVAALPARKTALGRWSCRKEGSTRICKHVPRGRPTLRIRFTTSSTVHQKSKPPPAGSPAPSPQPSPRPAPAPQDCLDLWNASGSHAFADDGYHFYVDHGIRQAWVFHMTDGTGRCAVIFVVPPTDYEYGTDGETENTARNGWILMDSTAAFGAEAVEVQTQARDNANASLSSLGTIAAL